MRGHAGGAHEASASLDCWPQYELCSNWSAHFRAVLAIAVALQSYRPSLPDRRPIADQARAMSSISLTEVVFSRGLPRSAPFLRSSLSSRCHASQVTSLAGSLTNDDTSMGASSSPPLLDARARSPAMRSAVEKASYIVLAMTPVGPRDSQPETYSPGIYDDISSLLSIAKSARTILPSSRTTLPLSLRTVPCRSSKGNPGTPTDR